MNLPERQANGQFPIAFQGSLNILYILKVQKMNQEQAFQLLERYNQTYQKIK